MPANGRWDLTLTLLAWRIWWAPNNASKWQMWFNSAFKGLILNKWVYIYIYWCVVTEWTGQLSRYSDWLRAERSGDRIPGGGAKFSAPIEIGPGAHPAACTMGTESFSGVRNGRGMTLTPQPFSYHGQERVELYLYFLYEPYGLYRASVPVQCCTFTFTCWHWRNYFRNFE